MAPQVLDDNELGDEAVAAFAPALHVNGSLQLLSLVRGVALALLRNPRSSAPARRRMSACPLPEPLPWRALWW